MRDTTSRSSISRTARRTDAERIVEESRREVAATLGLMTEFGVQTEAEREAALARITYIKPADADAALAGADVIFEGVPEVLEAKEQAFGLICQAAREDAIITSTTSTMLVDTLAAFVTTPERFINGHWLNPAFLIPLRRGQPGCGDVAGDRRGVHGVARGRSGKVPVVCAASPGFIVPRIQSLAMSEAARMVEEGVASAEEIDRATRVGFGPAFRDPRAGSSSSIGAASTSCTTPTVTSPARWARIASPRLRSPTG